MAWVVQQLREATPFGKQPKDLFPDNDGIYRYEVARFLKSCSIQEALVAGRVG